MKAAFSLLEVLFAIAVVALLIGIGVPATNRAALYAARTRSISDMRQLGVASRLYSNEHEQKLPGQLSSSSILPILPDPGAAGNRWPKLLCAYLSPSDPRVFLDPTDRSEAQLAPADIISNDQNNTGYVYNGFDDLSRDGQPLAEIPLTAIDQPVNTVLISQKISGAKDFYVDLLSGPLSLLTSLLNPAAFDGGAHYLYVDGSVRYLKQQEYSNQLWLVNKDLNLPPLLNAAQPRLVQTAPTPDVLPLEPGN